jgi:hypothetical protein
VGRASLPVRARIRVDLAPSILRVRDLPAQAPVVQVDRVRGLGLAHVRDLARRVLVDLVQVRAGRLLLVRLHALRVLRDRRVAVAASSIRRPKKAR